MKVLEKKQRIRRVIYSTPVLIVLSIMAFLLVKGAVGVMNKEWESKEQSKNLEKKAAALVIRERELKEGIRRLQTEEGIKDEIRERFSVTQKGELVAVIVDDSRVATSTDASLWPWYKKFWNVIISIYE